MAYQIKSPKSLDLEVRRIAHAEIRAAILASRRIRTVPDAVHAVRSHCKRTRALLHLVKTGLGDRYRTEDHAIRDIARRLSTFRDADVMQTSLSELVRRVTIADSRCDFAPLSAGLATELAQRQSDQAARTALALSAESLSSCLQRVDAWSLKGRRAHIVSAGLAATYGRAQALMRAAASGGSAHQFHEWRKHVKYHWLQLKLIRPISSRVYPGRTKRMSELSSLLGTLHDLDILDEWLRRSRKREHAATVLARTSKRRRLALRESALTLAGTQFDREPMEFVRPVGRNWPA